MMRGINNIMRGINNMRWIDWKIEQTTEVADIYKAEEALLLTNQ